MEQRPLRLGDIVDDYCTRERRVTNHAVVAIVEDAIRQTRCTTCDAEHPYKGAKEPRLRKKVPEEAYAQVLAEVNGARQAPSADAAPVPFAASAPEAGDVEDAVATDVADAPSSHDVWPGHRRLIRATLPRAENEPPPPRPIPEFTMHQRPQQGRGFRFRGQPNGNGNVNGNVNGHGQPGFGQGRPSRPGRHRHKKRPR